MMCTCSIVHYKNIYITINGILAWRVPVLDVDPSLILPFHPMFRKFFVTFTIKYKIYLIS